MKTSKPYRATDTISGDPNPGQHHASPEAGLVERWRVLLAELDRARQRFNETHVSLVSRMEALHNGGNAPAPRAHDMDAHDDAAAAWVIARDALIKFCRQHPQVC